MSKIIQSREGFVWLDVTPKANKIFFSKLFPLYLVWRDNEKTLRIPILDEIDLDYAMGINGMICIEVGDTKDSEAIDFVTLNSWESADKITHNGYVYVRYNDLTFCK